MSLVFYFTYYVLNMFRTLIYPSSGACDCVVELPQFEVQLQTATRTLLKPSRTKSPTHSEPRTKRPMW